MISGALLLGAACSVDKDQAAPTAEDPSTDTGAALESASPPAGEATIGRVPEIVQRVQPSVVTVITDRGEGSGVVYRPGTIVTNHHVVAAAQRFRVALASGERIDAKVRATDARSDLAVLDVPRADLPPATFAKSLPRVGSLAIAMGNPLGFENTVTLGIISGLGRSIPGSASETLALIDLVQTDAPLAHIIGLGAWPAKRARSDAGGPRVDRLQRRALRVHTAYPARAAMVTNASTPTGCSSVV